MPIVNSTYEFDGPVQPSGWRHVVERHADHTGVVHTARYRAAAGTDYTAVMTERAARLAEWLADAEAAALLEQG